MRRPALPTRLGVMLLPVLVIGLCVGCATSRSPTEIAADREDVLGVWTYRVSGSDVLQRGRLHIRRRDGRLVGRFEDRWHGTVRTRIVVEDTHMEFRVRHVRISGRLRHNRFRGAIQRDVWDASTRGNRRSSPGTLVARRVRSPAVSSSPELGCASLLRESSFACSALRPLY